MTKRNFGIEIEAISPVEGWVVACKLDQAGIDSCCEGYGHVTRSYWKITTDRSIQSTTENPFTMEIVSPILKSEIDVTSTEKSGFEHIKDVCKVLEKNDVKVNRTCGLHVHVDAHDFTIEDFKNLFRIWRRYQDAVYAMVAPSRKGNDYTLPIPEDRLTEMENLTSIQNLESYVGGSYRLSAMNNPLQRRYGLNVKSFWAYRTIEFRLHQGTVNADKIIAWVKFCIAMVSRAKNGSRLPKETRVVENNKNPKKLLYCLTMYNKDKLMYDLLDRKTQTFLVKRAREFAKV